jgi:hypothetical protein
LTTIDWIKIQRVSAYQIFNLNTWTPLWSSPFSSFKVKITAGRAVSDGLLLSSDLYYPLSSLDPRLLLEQYDNGELIL